MKKGIVPVTSSRQTKLNVFICIVLSHLHLYVLRKRGDLEFH